MPWDDLHESKEPKDSFKNRGGQGGGGQGEGPPQPPFNIPQIKIPQFMEFLFNYHCLKILMMKKF